jgi:hypothetical protein
MDYELWGDIWWRFMKDYGRVCGRYFARDYPRGFANGSPYGICQLVFV